jgi:hypothetical protein
MAGQKKPLLMARRGFNSTDSSHFCPVDGQETACLHPGWNWHLARQIALPPVAVVSSGQSLHHSE